MRRSIVALVVGLVLFGCGNAPSASSPVGIEPPSTSPTPTAEDGPTDSMKAARTIVPTPFQVLGQWELIRVHEQEPPSNAVRELRMSKSGGRFYASWSDGVNDHYRQWSLIRGTFKTGPGGETLVGCSVNPRLGKKRPCTRPSGFGVEGATALRLTSEGDLIFLDSLGEALAAYQPAE